MKRLSAKIVAFVSAVTLSVALLGTSFTVTGCKTGPSTNGTNTVDIDKIALGVQLAVKTGTQYALTKNPTTRVYFVASVEAINTFLLTSTNTSPAALEVALNNLPVDGIKSPEAQLAISTVLDIYTITYADTAKAAIAQSEAAVKLLTAARDGVSRGLALVPAPGFKMSVSK